MKNCVSIWLLTKSQKNVAIPNYIIFYAKKNVKSVANSSDALNQVRVYVSWPVEYFPLVSHIYISTYSVV